MLNTNYSEKFAKEGLTFDDVLLIPAESHVLPKEVDLTTRLTKTIKLNTPLMTAARSPLPVKAALGLFTRICPLKCRPIWSTG